MLQKMNDTFTSKYKNAEIVIVVEDDLITTTKIYIDGKCVGYSDISTKSNPEGAPFNRENYNTILESCKADVDKMFEELLAKINVKTA